MAKRPARVKDDEQDFDYGTVLQTAAEAARVLQPALAALGMNDELVPPPTDEAIRDQIEALWATPGKNATIAGVGVIALEAPNWWWSQQRQAPIDFSPRCASVRVA